MAVLPIVLYNDPVLRQKAEPVKTDSKELQVFIDDLFETMYEASGVGLAAPQVGRSLRVFVVDADVMVEDTDEQAYGPMAFINPEIHSKDNQQIIIEEGCLSLPELRENIARPDEITVKFLDRDFREQHMTFTAGCPGYFSTNWIILTGCFSSTTSDHSKKDSLPVGFSSSMRVPLKPNTGTRA